MTNKSKIKTAANSQNVSNKQECRSLLRPVLLTITLAFTCFALPQSTQAVTPAPDGGYPGGNTAEGQNALFSLTSGGYNTAVGYFSLRGDSTSSFNTAIGAGTLLANTADENTATGAAALLSNSTGTKNTANGAFALFSNTTGVNNTATGAQALFSNDGDPLNSEGSFNTAVGILALGHNTTGFDNIAMGANAGAQVTTANNVICIGAGGENVSNSCYIAHINGATIPNGTPVFVNGGNKLGTMTSSRQFKKDINTMEKASEAILALRPVTFQYKSDANGTPQFGLIAEEVAKVNPALVLPDKEGKPYSVRYEAVNAMLLNEFLKEHRKNEQQEGKIQAQAASIATLKSTVAQQQKGMEAVTARLNEQTAQIQTVSAQLEANKPARQVVNNP